MRKNRNVERRTILKAAGASAADAGAGRDDGVRWGQRRFRGRDGDTPLRVVGWRDRATIAIKKTIALFEKKYPKIKVKTEFRTTRRSGRSSRPRPPAEIRRTYSRMRSASFASTTSEAFCWISSRRRRRESEPGQLPQRRLANGQVDGKQLGIPVGANTMALVIDLKVFKKAGVEAEDGLDLGRVLRRRCRRSRTS